MILCYTILHDIRRYINVAGSARVRFRLGSGLVRSGLVWSGYLYISLSLSVIYIYIYTCNISIYRSIDLSIYRSICTSDAGSPGPRAAETRRPALMAESPKDLSLSLSLSLLYVYIYIYTHIYTYSM